MDAFSDDRQFDVAQRAIKTEVAKIATADQRVSLGEFISGGKSGVGTGHVTQPEHGFADGIPVGQQQP